MKHLKIDHLGIAVPSLEPAIAAYEALGFRVEATHDVPTERVRTAFLPVGESHLELLEPTDPASAIGRFLEKRSGLHHVCVLVDDLDAVIARAAAAGATVLEGRASGEQGDFAWIVDCDGNKVELWQPPARSGR